MKMKSHFDNGQSQGKENRKKREGWITTLKGTIEL